MRYARNDTNNRLLHTFGLAALILIPAMMSAQVDRTKAPQPGPAPEVRLGEHHTFTLENGMRVIIVENHKAPIVSAQLRFDIPPTLQGEMVGYQELVGELLTSGTVRHTKEQLDERIDGLGARVSGSSNGLYGASLKKNFPQLMDLMYEVVSSATYPAEEFEKARTRMLSGIQARVDAPDEIAQEVGNVLTYGKRYPYGEVATEESVKNVTRKAVHQYYKYFFQPANGYLVLVGDITAKEGEKLAKKYFNTWKGADVEAQKNDKGNIEVKGLGEIVPASGEPRLPNDVRVAVVDRPGSAQSVVRLVFPMQLKPNDPQALAVQVFNSVLGGGVFNARLMQNLREDKGYTYGAYSSVRPNRWCGAFSAGCSVRNEVTDSAAVELINELKAITSTRPITEEELALAKSYMAGSFARSIEDPRTVARYALNTYLDELPQDHYENYLKNLDALTLEDVQAAASYFHPDNCTILVVGDKEQVGEKLKALSPKGAVQEYDINGEIVRMKPNEGLTPAPEGMVAQDVLDAYINAIGGEKAVAAIKDLRMEYTTSVQGMEATVIEYYKAPHSYAMEMKMGGQTLQRLAYDGGDKAMMNSFMGDQELVDTDLEDLLPSTYAFPELHYQELEQTGKLMGIEEIDGRKAYRIQVLMMNNKADEYFDVETGLKVRSKEYQKQGGDSYVQVTTDYSDYQPEAGVLFPHTLKQSGGPGMVLKATSINVNKGIEDAVFSLD